MKFKDWLTLLEGGKGSGNKKISATGFNAGGGAQSGNGMFKPAKPHFKLKMRFK